MKKTAIMLMMIMLISKMVGFAKYLTLSYFFGVSNITDAYIISLTIPTVIFSFIGAGISTGFIPMYSKIKSNYGLDKANYYTNNLINILMIVCTFLMILGLLFTNQIVKIFAFGFTGETLELAVLFTRINIFSIYFTSIIYIFNGYLQLSNKYVIPALGGLILNIFLIVSIIVGYSVTVIILAIGTVLASFFQVVFTYHFVKKRGYVHKLVVDFKSEHIRKMAIIAIPVIIGVSVNQINVLVDRTIASQIASGAISALNYANNLNLFIQGIFVMSIATVLYPRISKMAAENNMKELKSSLSGAITGVNLLVVPATVGSIIFAVPIVATLFGRGAFDQNAIVMTSSALFFYSIGMIGFGHREILSKAFYSMQDTKTPMINAAIGMIINIILNIILSRYMGIGGLALATSIAAIVTAGLMIISLRKKIGAFGIKQLSISFIKILIASIIMGVFARLSFNYLTLTFDQNVSLFLAIIIGAFIYLIAIYFMKIRDVDVIFSGIKGKLNKKM
ncbi:murein biosynthesis integral membrane protein MurJ [Sutcliffiella cohnii]